MTCGLARRLVVALGLVATTVAGATELADLGRFGPTCPVPEPPPVPSGARIRLQPARAGVAGPAEPSMPVATARRTYTLPTRWPHGTPPLLAFVGRDPGSLAVIQTLPPGTPVFVLPSDGGIAVEAIRRACPACRLARASAASARQLGVAAVPVVFRVRDGAAQATEGPP
jgi:hypothetical protein